MFFPHVICQSPTMFTLTELEAAFFSPPLPFSTPLLSLRLPPFNCTWTVYIHSIPKGYSYGQIYKKRKIKYITHLLDNHKFQFSLLCPLHTTALWEMRTAWLYYIYLLLSRDHLFYLLYLLQSLSELNWCSVDVSLLLSEVFLICKIAGFLFPGFIIHSDACTLSQMV